MNLPVPVHALIARLNEAGFSAYAVGGCVRDGLLGTLQVQAKVIRPTGFGTPVCQLAVSVIESLLPSLVLVTDNHAVFRNDMCTGNESD